MRQSFNEVKILLCENYFRGIYPGINYLVGQILLGVYPVGNYQRAIILRATLIGCNYPESNYPDTGVFKYLQHDLLYHFDLFYFFKLEKKGNKPKRRNATKKVSRVASLLLLLNKFLIVSSREVTETHQSSPQMLIHNTWRQNQEGEKQNSLINAFV